MSRLFYCCWSSCKPAFVIKVNKQRLMLLPLDTQSHFLQFVPTVDGTMEAIMLLIAVMEALMFHAHGVPIIRLWESGPKCRLSPQDSGRISSFRVRIMAITNG